MAKYTTRLINKATIYVVALLLLLVSCQDNYKRVGEEAVPFKFPQGVATNIELTYTETHKALTTEDTAQTHVIAILRSPLNKDFDNLPFQYKEFPDGLEVEFYDESNKKSTVIADYGIIYSQTNLIDLRGHVVITTHDGKKLQTEQLYWDRVNKWIFTEEDFIFTNPEDGTEMQGSGMDFNREFTYFSARQTFGIMTIKEETND